MRYLSLKDAEEEALNYTSAVDSEIELSVEQLAERLSNACSPVARLIEDGSYTLYDIEDCRDKVNACYDDLKQSIHDLKVVYNSIMNSLTALARAKREEIGDDY